MGTVEHDFWASSLYWSPGESSVHVPTVNLIRLLYENALPGDFVVVEMDIEGAEWDILPCLSHSAASNLIDELYMEIHDPNWGLLGTNRSEFMDAVNKLRDEGTIFPAFNTDVRRL